MFLAKLMDCGGSYFLFWGSLYCTTRNVEFLIFIRRDACGMWDVGRPTCPTYIIFFLGSKYPSLWPTPHRVGQKCENLKKLESRRGC